MIDLVFDSSLTSKPSRLVIKSQNLDLIFERQFVKLMPLRTISCAAFYDVR